MMLHELCTFLFEFVCYAMCSRFNLICEGVVKVVKVVKCCETICCKNRNNVKNQFSDRLPFTFVASSSNVI